MVISKTLEDAINNKKISAIRSVFYSIAHEDPSFSTGKFVETFEYVKSKNIEGLFDEFDGTEFKPEEEWDEEYWAEVASELMDNFCAKRINHLMRIGRKIYPKIKKTVPVQNHRTNSNSNASTRPQATKDPIRGLFGMPSRTTSPQRPNSNNNQATGPRYNNPKNHI